MEVKSKNVRNHHLVFFIFLLGWYWFNGRRHKGIEIWYCLWFRNPANSWFLKVSSQRYSESWTNVYTCVYIYIYTFFNINICKVYLCHNLYSCNMSEASSLGMVDFARSLYGHFAGRSRTRLCSGMAVMHCRRAEASILEPPRWEETVHPPLTGWR